MFGLSDVCCWRCFQVSRCFLETLTLTRFTTSSDVLVSTRHNKWRQSLETKTMTSQLSQRTWSSQGNMEVDTDLSLFCRKPDCPAPGAFLPKSCLFWNQTARGPWSTTAASTISLHHSHCPGFGTGTVWRVWQTSPLGESNIFVDAQVFSAVYIWCTCWKHFKPST